MFSSLILSATAILAITSASAQSLDLSLLGSISTPANVTVPSNLTSQLVDYDVDAATDAAAEDPLAAPATVNLADTVTTIVNSTTPVQNSKRAATSCVAQPLGSGPAVSPDTASAFLANAAFAKSASAAPTPSGYIQSFKNLKASNNAFGYLGYTALDSYDTAACASQCNAIADCSSFNLYFERDPTVDPGTGCTNPKSTTVIKCVFWGGPVTSANANNQGQYRSNFHVVIAGSNGYINKTIDDAYGYASPAYYGTASIDAPGACNSGAGTVIGTKVFTNIPFDASLCAAVCDAQTAAGTTCVFFNTFIVNRNGVSIGQYCRTFSAVWSPSYATYTGATVGSNVYTIDHSYGFTSVNAVSSVANGLVL